jgi:hypothetical protein
MLCFLQQIELINNDFFTKIVRTNYCVPLKSIESTTPHSHINNKQSNKLFQHLFPPPPPLPLPKPSENFSPLLSRHSDSSNPIRIPINSSSAPPPPAPPPLPSALSFPSRSSSSHHHLILTSPSPPTTSVSKFAQVRDIFARAEATTSVKNYHSIPTKNHIISSHTIPSIEQCRSPKSASVLNAVQEYQRQHINNHQPAVRRFVQSGNNAISNANRSPNIGGLRSRGIGLNNNKLQTKPSLSAYTTSSPQPQPKSISRVIKSLPEEDFFPATDILF